MLNLELGKEYRNRAGDTVTIIRKNYSEAFPFQDYLGHTYDAHGNYNRQLASSLKDLVEEVPVPPPHF